MDISYSLDDLNLLDKKVILTLNPNDKSKVLVSLSEDVKGAIKEYKKGEVISEIDTEEFDDIYLYRDNFKGIIKEDLIKVITSIELHLHTEYSLLDGSIKIKELVKKVEGACAITDHGVMYGVIEFYKAMKEEGKKPILGFEAYSEDINGKRTKNHLVLLAKNRTGFNNLVKLSTLGHQNFYIRPQIKWEWLEKYSEGVICLSACMGGELARAIMKNKEDVITEYISRMKSIFKDDFYIEIQRHNIEGERELNERLLEIAKKEDIKVVATSDAHYLNESDKEVHEMLLCLQTGTTMSNEKRFKFRGKGYHVPSIEEKESLFYDRLDVLTNTLEIEDKVDLYFEFGKYTLPEFKLPKEYTDINSKEYLKAKEYYLGLYADEINNVSEDEKESFKDNLLKTFDGEGAYLIALSIKGLDKRILNNNNIRDIKEKIAFITNRDEKVREYKERLAYEIKTILGMNLQNYFLIVQDIVNFAKSKGIFVGPGRGSACGSLLAYAINITNLNPIPYGLLFERFINPDRVSMAD